MFLDVSKYILTIVVVGKLISGRLDEWAVLFGFILSCVIMFIGFLTIPEEEK